MKNDTNLDIPHHFEIFEQDLTKPYLQLTLCGTTRTIEEARQCCRLLQEALETSHLRGLGELRGKKTYIFVAVMNGDMK